MTHLLFFFFSSFFVVLGLCFRLVSCPVLLRFVPVPDMTLPFAIRHPPPVWRKKKKKSR